MKKIIMTMEELDEAQAHFDKLGSYTKNHFGLGIVDSIIATAKAFHELKAEEFIGFCKRCGEKATYRNGIVYCCGVKVEPIES